MYKAIIRPLFFLIDPERAHHVVAFAVRLLAFIPGLRQVTGYFLNYSPPELRTSVAGLEFKNKVLLAAGFDKNAGFFREFFMFGFSGIEIGTVTPKPQPGNPLPRLFRLPPDKALINRMGFNNKGADYAADRLKKRSNTEIIGGNIGKNTATPNEQAAEDYAYCFNALYDHVDYISVNVSCPNIAGLEKLQNIDSLGEILNRIALERKKKGRYKPVFLKISPDLSFRHIDEIIALCKDIGLDGIIATNTTTSRKGLITGEEDISRIGPGGLSGHPLRKRALEIVSYICKQSGNTIPVIGVGGVITPEDAVEMINAGASLVQVYTGFIYEGPLLVRRINKALARNLKQNQLVSGQ